MCGFGGRCCLRHARESFPHVGNDVDDHTSMFLHPRGVDCVGRTQSHRELYQTHTLNQCSPSASHPAGSSGRSQSGWCLSQLSSLSRTCALPGCWTGLLHCSPGSLSCRTASALTTREISPEAQGVKTRRHSQIRRSTWSGCRGRGCACRPTSSSFRMLHGRGVTLAGLVGGIFCLISWAAASNFSAFLLEITTLQPEDTGVSQDKTMQDSQLTLRCKFCQQERDGCWTNEINKIKIQVKTIVSSAEFYSKDII